MQTLVWLVIMIILVYSRPISLVFILVINFGTNSREFWVWHALVLAFSCYPVAIANVTQSHLNTLGGPQGWRGAISSPRDFKGVEGEGDEVGVSSSQPIRGSGEGCKLPEWGAAEKWFGTFSVWKNTYDGNKLGVGHAMASQNHWGLRTTLPITPSPVWNVIFGKHTVNSIFNPTIGIFTVLFMMLQ